MQEFTVGVASTYRFLLVDAADDETGAPGKSPTVSIVKPGSAAFANSTNAPTAIDRGWYQVTLTAAELNTAGPMVIEATGTGTDVWRDVVMVKPAIAGPFTVTLTTAQLNTIADRIGRRNLANMLTSADGDTLDEFSIAGVIAKMIGRVRYNTVTGKIEVYKPDGTTLFFTQSATPNSSAAAIVEVGNPD